MLSEDFAVVIESIRDERWEPWQYLMRPLYSDDTPWEESDLDLSEHVVGYVGEYTTEYVEEYGGKCINVGVTVGMDEIERQPSSEAIRALILGKLETALACVADLKASMDAKEPS